MHKPPVDILLTTFNGAKFLPDQLDSLFAQTHLPRHIFIGDDGSKDETLAIINQFINKYPNTITLLPPSEKLGVIKNFSRLIPLAKADYVMFSDQDDIWKKEKLEQTLSKMQEAEKSSSLPIPILVHTDLEVVDQDLKMIAPSFWKYTHLNPFKTDQLNRLLAQNVVTGCTMMINKAMLNLCFPIPENVIMHDWWAALVASAFGRVVPLNKATLLYRQHSNNTLGAKKFSIFKQLMQWRNLSKKIEERKKTNPKAKRSSRKPFKSVSNKITSLPNSNDSRFLQG